MNNRPPVLQALLAVAVLAIACANPSLPPGGPPDEAPPVILSVSPENNSVGTTPKSLKLQFNEVISESPKGASNLKDLIFISPKSGEPRVSWKRNRLEIHPSDGWKPNAVYSIQIKPGIQDLRNNTIDSSIALVFSTGGAIPDTRITGVAFDWAAAKGISSAVVEAISADSVVYQVVSDTAGRFELRNLPPGPYVVRAFADRNNNREPDRLEIWDSAGVTLTENASAELYAFLHDTVGLRITEVALLDTNRVIKVTYDKPYPSEQVFTPDMIVVQTSDSTRLAVRSVQTAPAKAAADSAIAKAKADSIAREIESKLDTSEAARAERAEAAERKRADSVAAAERALQERQRQAAAAARARGVRPPPLDTMPLPKMNRPEVSSEIFITLDEPLSWQSQFRLQTDGVSSLSGTVKSPNRAFSTPREPVRDSTARQPADTSSAADPDTSSIASAGAGAAAGAAAGAGTAADSAASTPPDSVRNGPPARPRHFSMWWNSR